MVVRLGFPGFRGVWVWSFRALGFFFQVLGFFGLFQAWLAAPSLLQELLCRRSVRHEVTVCIHYFRYAISYYIIV